MNGRTDDPQTSEDDIPTLTEIVVPGRIQGAPADDPPPRFDDDADDALFDVDLGMPRQAHAAPPPAEDTDLPLPAADIPPELLATEGMQPAVKEPMPLIVAARAKAQAQQARQVKDEEAQLYALVGEIGDGLEQRLQAEIALIEQRLRAAVREELDTCLQQLKNRSSPAP